MVDALVQRMHDAQYFNVSVVHVHFNEVIMQLPFSEHLVGNPASGAVHTGAIHALMQACSSANAVCAMFYYNRNLQLPALIDLRVDHMHPVFSDKPVLARSHMCQVTEEAWHAKCIAYQSSVDTPCAIAAATYLCGDTNLISQEFRSDLLGEAK